MAYKDIKAGKYMAKPIAGAFGRSKTKQTPQVGVEFQFQTPEGTTETMWWVGFLTPDAKERALEVLHLIGFNGDESFAKGSFNETAEVEIVVEIETYEGKNRPKIAWVNAPGGQRFSNLQPTEVKTMLVQAGIDIKKEMAAMKAKKGPAQTAAPEKKAEAPF